MSQPKKKGPKYPRIAQSNIDSAIKNWEWGVFARVLFLMPIVEELLYRLPVLIAGLFGQGFQGLVALVSLGIFILSHRKLHHDRSEFMKAVPTYLVLGVVCTMCVTMNEWYVGLPIAIAVHFAWNLWALSIKSARIHLNV